MLAHDLALARSSPPERARELAVRSCESARSILPQSALAEYVPRPVAPWRGEGTWHFDNGFVRASVGENGALLELRTAQGRNVVAQGNLLAAQAGRWPCRVVPEGAALVDDGLEVRFALRHSRLLMRITLDANDPFLRVELAAVWGERGARLRSEHWLALTAGGAETNDRYARVTARDGTGCAIFADGASGWRTRALKRGGVHLALPLLSGIGWFGRGGAVDASFSFAYAPFENVPPSAIERAWEVFAHPARVPLFVAGGDGVIVEATKPAADGDGGIVRLREADGASRRASVRCGGRAKTAVAVDESEREVGGDVVLEDGAFVFTIDPLARRSFRVRFG